MRRKIFDIPEEKVAYKKEWMRAYRQRNKAKLTTQGRVNLQARRKANKEKAAAYFNNECQHCKLVSPHLCVYDFHHLDMSEKEADPGSLLHYSWDRIQKELDKCIMLCANCHRIEHQKDNNDLDTIQYRWVYHIQTHIR
jgi:hypothetical protein